MAREMTPQERAAAVLDQMVVNMPPRDARDYNEQVIENALRHARRAALLECKDEINKLVGKDSGNWNRAIVYAVDAIDRLAQEG